MKNILKKIIRFFKKHPIYTYIGIGLFIVLFVPKYFIPIWLSTWIFYFYFYTAMFFVCLFELCKPIYFLYTKNKKRLHAYLYFNKKPTKTLLVLRILESLMIILVLFSVLPVIKHTVVSLAHEDVSIKKVYTVEKSGQGGFGWITHIYIKDPEFNIGGSASERNSLYTFLFLHPFRPKPDQEYYFHYLPLSSFLRVGVILDYYPVDENRNRIYDE